MREIFDTQLYNSMLKKLNLLETKQEEVLFHYVVLNYFEGESGHFVSQKQNDQSQTIFDEYQYGDYASSPKSLNESLKDIIIQQTYSNFLEMKITQFDQDTLLDDYNHQCHQFQLDAHKEKLIKKRFPSLKMVNMCQQGDQFGEIALIKSCRMNCKQFCVQQIVNCLLLQTVIFIRFYNNLINK